MQSFDGSERVLELSPPACLDPCSLKNKKKKGLWSGEESSVSFLCVSRPLLGTWASPRQSADNTSPSGLRFPPPSRRPAAAPPADLLVGPLSGLV
jgi:hypothetical protein